MNINYRLLSATYNNYYTLTLKNISKKEINSFGEILSYRNIGTAAISFNTVENENIIIMEENISNFNVDHDFKIVELTIKK